MRAIELNMSDEVYKKLETMALHDKQPLEVFAVHKLEELARALDDYQELERRANAGDRRKFSEAMAKVPKSAPVKGDEF
jgi:hypothetical protein